MEWGSGGEDPAGVRPARPSGVRHDDAREVAAGLATLFFVFAEIVGEADVAFAMRALASARATMKAHMASRDLSDQDRKAILGALDKAEQLALRAAQTL